jgi:YD repeat-containing protein
VDNAETLLDETTETYTRFSFGERLTETTVVYGDSPPSTTTYTYYHSGQPKAIGLLESVTRPDGSWTKTEYDSQGRVSRTLRPWLSAPTTAMEATFENSAATTYSYIGSDESWQFESVLGVVTSRSWTRQKWDQLDPLMMATDYAWRMPMWRLTLPSAVRHGELAKADRPLGISMEPGGPIVDLGASGSITQKLQSFTPNPVSYSSVSPQQWNVRQRQRPPAFKLHDKIFTPAQPASISIQCIAETSPTGGLVLMAAPVTLPERTTLEIGPFIPASGGTAEGGADGGGDALPAAHAVRFTVRRTCPMQSHSFLARALFFAIYLEP